MLFLIIASLTMLLCGCSEALNCLSGDCINDNSDAVTSAVIHLDKNNLSITPDSTDSFTFTVKGGESKESFEILLNDPQLSFTSSQKNLHSTEEVIEKDVSLSVNSCILNNYDNKSCTITASMSKTGIPGRYSLKPQVFELKSIKVPVEMPNIVIQASRQTASDSKTIEDYTTINTNSSVVIDEADSKIFVNDVPYTDQAKLANLDVTFSTTGEHVYVVYDDGREIEQKSSGETLNFLTTKDKYYGHLKYKVVAQDTSFRFYDVYVNVAKASDKDLTSYTIIGEDTHTPESGNVFNLTTRNSNLAHVEVAFTTNGEKVEYEYNKQWILTKPSPTSTVIDFSKGSIPYRVTAQDGSINYYTVNVRYVNPTDSDWKYVGESNISVGSAAYVSIAINPSDNQPTVAYIDRTATNKVVVKHYNGSSWQLLSDSKVENASNVSLAISNDGKITYVAYKSSLAGIPGYLIKYSENDKQWTKVGETFFGKVSSRVEKSEINVAVNPFNENTPYVSYLDANGDNTKVTYFDGNNWKEIFATSNTPTEFPLIAFDSKGELYLSYINANSSRQIQVLKYDQILGKFSNPIAVTNASVSYSNFIVGKNDIPYVTFYNNSTTDTNVYSGESFTQWNSIGDQFTISGADAAYQNIATDVNGTLYVVFNQKNKGSTVKYNAGNKWLALGTTGFSNANAAYIDFAISKTNPYVAYIHKINDEEGYVSVMYYTKGLAPKN